MTWVEMRAKQKGEYKEPRKLITDLPKKQKKKIEDRDKKISNRIDTNIPDESQMNFHIKGKSMPEVNTTETKYHGPRRKKRVIRNTP